MFLNCSLPSSYPRAVMSSTAYLTSVCYSICFCIALLGNGTMFLILIRNQRTKVRRVHTLLLHMNLAHLIVTLIYMPKEIIHNITVAWWGGDVLCRTCKFFDNFGNALAANVLICISLDRFYSIYSPLYTLNSRKFVKFTLICAWMVSLIASLPSAFLFRASPHPCAAWFKQCVSGDLVGAVRHSLVFAYTVINLIQVYILPLIFTVACYSLILYKISSKTRDKLSNSVNGREMELRQSGKTYERARSRTLRMTFVVVIAFLLCWTPYAAASFIHFTIQPSPIPLIMRKLIYAFAVFNSAISPYLYGYFSFNLKKELQLLVGCSTFSDSSDRHKLSITGSFTPRKKMATTVVENLHQHDPFDQSKDRVRLLCSHGKLLSDGVDRPRSQLNPNLNPVSSGDRRTSTAKRQSALRVIFK